MRNIVIEGARGLGKSSITRFLRDQTTNSTLINFTGFNEDSEEGCEKVATYYQKWSEFFNSLRGQEMTFIHDRYLFSEMVYSQLYKSYNFRPYFDVFMKRTPLTFDRLDLVILHGDRETIGRNLNRDKAQLFGNVEESVAKSWEQQDGYLNLATELTAKDIPRLNVYLVNVTGKSIEELGNGILSLLSYTN